MTTIKIIPLQLIGRPPTELKIVEVDGVIQLVDIYINNEWQGSRRTINYAMQYIKGRINDGV